MGVHGGVLGETCALAIVLGLIYLVVTKTISIAIPAAYVVQEHLRKLEKSLMLPVNVFVRLRRKHCVNCVIQAEAAS